ncbi:Lrp/AsnC family transcriptional regulator [Thermoactinospora rubra]|uniref:Lrp/AsnC family transcriptional regulator n=1 Tax=Thermoactinospora rubra TaxID=1088767 RepID=UPI000A0F5E8A|nr:Lrp/AsnC family transcriptional regulator [Thermoactinospora rubra]
MNSSRSAGDLDDLDWKLLEELQADARLSYNELARRVHLSAPAVADRIRRLERRGVIVGYQAQIDPAAAGFPIQAYIQLRCALGHCLLKSSAAEDYPEVIEIDKLSGRHCSMLRVRASSLAHLEGVLEQIGKHGEMDTHIVLSTQYQDLRVRRTHPDRPVTPSAGWTRRRAEASNSTEASNSVND